MDLLSHFVQMAVTKHGPAAVSTVLNGMVQASVVTLELANHGLFVKAFYPSKTLAERKVKEDERQFKEEAARKDRVEAARKAKEEAEKKAKDEAKTKAKEEAEIRATVEAEKKLKKAEEQAAMAKKAEEQAAKKRQQDEEEAKKQERERRRALVDKQSEEDNDDDGSEDPAEGESVLAFGEDCIRMAQSAEDMGNREKAYCNYRKGIRFIMEGMQKIVMDDVRAGLLRAKVGEYLDCAVRVKPTEGGMGTTTSTVTDAVGTNQTSVDGSRHGPSISTGRDAAGTKQTSADGSRHGPSISQTSLVSYKIVTDIEDMDNDGDILADHGALHLQVSLLKNCGRWLAGLDEVSSERCWVWLQERAICKMSPSVLPEKDKRPEMFARAVVANLSNASAEELHRISLRHGFGKGKRPSWTEVEHF